MNFKRRRHKNARAGCRLCKPWKSNRDAKAKWRTVSERQAEQNEKELRSEE